MFGFFRRKKPPVAPPPAPETDASSDDSAAALPDGTIAEPASTPAAATGERPVAAPAPASDEPTTPETAAAPGMQAAPAEATPTAAAPAREAAAAVEAPAAAPEADAGSVAPSPAAAPGRQGWLDRLRGGLSRTRGNLATIFVSVKVDEALYEELETALLASDAGVATTQWLIEQLRERARRNRIGDAAALKAALRDLLTELLEPLQHAIDVDRATPLVMMIVGVNGAGKTTSIGKLARHLRAIDKSVLLAAGDTFRAAAREQLARWGERNEVQVIANEGGDPAAVAFDAVKAGVARRTGVVMIDTAGRLPTQRHLMEELRKIRRVLGKAMEGAPHEVLLVLDGNTGQNMLNQVKAFDEAVELTGLVVTKLDGTAKGGAIAALAHTRRDRPIPVYFIGVGEGVEDLEAFSAKEFASALLD
ncbi:MAG: signal recognition particle-docking protein FtsY [Burkholderiaceae bacterium]|nr:signal recognition particle-docking protein FtsY [Burkholderiaceae bacterium]